MHPNHNYCCGWFNYEKEEKKPTLSELQEQMEDIEDQINQVRKLDVSATVKICALTELKEKKADIKRAMHKCIDEM